jgi:oligopeptidase B
MTNGTPAAPRRDHVWKRPTGDVHDAYAWLIERDNPATLAYLNEENEHTKKWFEERNSDVSAIFEEIKSRINEDDSSYPVSHRGWWYSSRTESGKSYAIHSRGQSVDTANDFVMLDENIEAAEHEYFALSAFEVSNDSNFVAWSFDIDGGEYYTIRIRDLSTGLDLADTIPNSTYGGVAWSSDDQWLFYVMPDEQMRPWQVWRHRIGTPAEQDVLILEEKDERFFVGVGATRSGEWIVIESGSKTSSEAWVIDAQRPTSDLISIAPRRDDVEYQVDHWGNHFAITTNLDALDFRVMLAPINAPSQWIEFVPHFGGQRIAQFDCFQNFAVMQRWVDAQQVISIVDRNAVVTPIAILAEPHEAELDSNPDFDATDIRFSYQSLTTPAVTAQYNVTTREIVTLKRISAPNCDLAQYVSERVWATAPDGTRIPLDTVRHRDTPLNGSAPGLIYGYGSYEISIAPWFSAGRLSLLDRGWVWALAHPRGGGEMGRQWYLDGKLLKKRNTFTDTIACADYLASSGMCDGSKLVVRGGSAGGLLVGACITINPQRFAGAIAEVPFVDVVSTMSDPSLPLTVTEWEEWGDPRAEPFATYMESYSPYDNTRNVDYPNVYVTAGVNDPRVSYHEPTKWVAKLRHESPKTTVLFHCEMGAGHGGPSGRYEQWWDEARTLAFAVHSVK